MDIVFTDMMLNQVENIRTPIQEAYRVLKKGGIFLAIVTHPAWDLYEYALDKAGTPSGIFKGILPYFKRGYSYFVTTTESIKPAPGEEIPEAFEVPHYQHTIQDYFQTMIEAKFQVKQMLEPELTKSILKKFPDYESMKCHPVGLIFLAKK